MAEESLKHKAVAGVLWSSVQQFGTSIISFLSNIVLARLLTPNDFGCIGLLAIFIAISNVFIVGGFISALIQKKETTSLDYSTAFFWNIVVSLFCYILIYLIAPKIAVFYRISMLTDIIRVLGLVLIINALSVVQSTILRKSFQFNKLAKIGIFSTVFSVCIAITLAYKGWGVWSLVAQQIVFSVCNAGCLWYKSTWIPRFQFSIKSFKEMFGYGSFLLLSDLLNNFVDNLQGLIIGRKYSTTDMGHYTQAKKLEEIPTTSISSVVGYVTFPMYSSIQHDRARLGQAVKKSMGMMNYVNFPLMILLIVIAKPLFLLLYSEKWIGSVEYFQILCTAGLVNCMQSVNYQVVAAVGKSKELFRWNVVKRIVGILLMVLGSNYGVRGVLYGMVISFYFTYVVNACLANQSTGYSLLMQLRDSLPLFLLSVIPALIAFIFSFFSLHYLFLLPIQVLTFLLTYLTLTSILRKEEYSETINILKNSYHNLFK